MGVLGLSLQMHSLLFPFCSESQKSTPVGCLSQALKPVAFSSFWSMGSPPGKSKVGIKGGAHSRCLLLSVAAAPTVAMSPTVKVLHWLTLWWVTLAPVLLQCHLILLLLCPGPGDGC